MTYRAFDVVVVPFPYSDRLAEKRRPALVVSDDRLEVETGRLWVAMITSVPSEGIGDVALLASDRIGLKVGSWLRAGKVATIDADRVLRRIGRLSLVEEQAARAALTTCAGF